MQHDCVIGGRCYRYHVPTSPRSLRGSGNAALLSLLLAIAGCATPHKAIDSRPAVSDAPVPPLAGPEPWWRQTGDPVLATLVAQGLDANAGLACRIAALRRQDRAADALAKTLGAALKRLFADKMQAQGRRDREARAQGLADRRARLAEDIALAYVEVRRLQQIGALRSGLIGQYKDNAEIAEFRRQAGLVPALDGALARSQDETARAELGYADARLDEALAALARLVGEKSDTLTTRLGETGALPALSAPSTVAQDKEQGEAHGEDASADAGQREARLSDTLETARRAARDARIAYREGAGNIATLYVAEAAALSVEQALIDARAERVSAAIRSRGAHGDDWARIDVERLASISATAAAPADGGDCGCDCD
ncbi:hypothetical protein SAMN05518801_13816 [Novosphingobium sp. CF614]|uniref:hypothetical protein n=1 Tax=Novosphingobium sp. CF614 TaxID=1884364 RepID=UPI0008EA27DA|nr:hypothetical protein [Novosphingobium sp. CF614]SFG51412.1 hypothetical protein SAMN05518801_13816 [Novosphingobium sp. CF614]